MLSVVNKLLWREFATRNDAVKLTVFMMIYFIICIAGIVLFTDMNRFMAAFLGAAPCAARWLILGVMHSEQKIRALRMDMVAERFFKQAA